MGAIILQFVAMQQLPNRIREWRKARDLTLEELAGKLNCSFTQVSHLELGKRELTQHWMVRIAAVLGVDAADLLLEEQNSGALSPDERDLIDRLRQASPETRQSLMRVSEALMPYLPEPEPRRRA